jgi:hypothetical protein
MQGIADSFSFILGYFRFLLQCHKHLNYALSHRSKMPYDSKPVWYHAFHLCFRNKSLAGTSVSVANATPSDVNLLSKGGVYGPREAGGARRRARYGAVARRRRSLHEIGRAFGNGHSSMRFLLLQRGGIIPAVRRRSLLALTLTEREEISRGIACGSSIRNIAKGLERAASTVSREVARHGAVLSIEQCARWFVPFARHMPVGSE